MKYTLEYIPLVDSTSNELRRRGECVDGLCLYAREQTAGKGQRGNHWESEAGKNLLFSICLHPTELAAGEFFILSEQVALAVADTIDPLLLPLKGGETSTIKWPNDAYVGEQKISGTLIENTLSGGRIQESIIGIGINLNQTEWKSDAPNPVSLKQLTGRDYDIREVLEQFLLHLDYWREQTHEQVQQAYFERLYRKDGWHLFKSLKLKVESPEFEARITGIQSDGGMELTLKNGKKQLFYFKEVKFLPENLEI